MTAVSCSPPSPACLALPRSAGCAISPAQASEKFEVEKTDAEWRAQLTPQQYEILRKEGTERPDRARCSRSIARASSPAPAATCRCSPRRRNLKAAPAGRASTSRSRTPSARPKTAPSGCCAPKFIAAAAAAISVTSSTMGRSRPACATAWTALRCCFIRRASTCRSQPESTSLEHAFARQLLPARQMCPGPWTGAFLFKH